MNCIEAIRNNPVPSDVFLKTTKLYYQMGKNSYYEQLFLTNYDHISKHVAAQDAYAFFKIFFSDLKISESRYRTLLIDSTVPKNSSEQIYKNLVFIFAHIKKKNIEPFRLNVTEVNDLVRVLFKNIKAMDSIKYRRFKESTHSLLTTESNSMREELEKLIRKFNKLSQAEIFEPLILHVNFIVDFINMKIYTGDKNDLIGILILYILMGQNRLIVSNYVSFFAKMHLYKDELINALARSKFQWSEGLAEIMPLIRLLIKVYTEIYLDLEEKSRDFEYEMKLEISKSDYVENTIMKLDEIFAKDEIRERHPLISDSTINRTLKRLQLENKIRPLGKGRSAKWIKLVKTSRKMNFQEQLKLNLGDQENE